MCGVSNNYILEVEMKCPALFLFSVLLVLSLTAYGYGYPGAMGQGSIMPGIDAVSHGFGGVVSVNVGSINLFGNPAELISYNPLVSASIGPLILKQIVDDGMGKHTLTYAGAGASSFQAGLSAGSAEIALGIAKVRDYTYTGERFFSESSPDTTIAGFENLTVTGGVWEAATGAATTLAGKVNIGASAGYRMGDINYDYYWHHFSESISDSSASWGREEGEFSWRAGVSVAAGETVTVGSVYASQTENCPSSIAAGVCVGNIAAYSPGFGLEARVYDMPDGTAWSANVFGGIHPDHNLYFRGGSVLSSTGGADSKVSLGISMGATIELGKTDLSAAFNYGSETRDSSVFGFPQVQTVSDVVTAFTVGASIEL